VAEFHKDQLPEDGLHVAIRWRVADQAARDALLLTPDEVGGLLFQNDVQSIFVLTNTAPVTWSQVPDGESTLAAIIAINTELLERVEGPAASNDNAVVRYDGTSGKLVQDSLATLSDSGFLTVENLHVVNDISVAGTVDGVDVGNLAMALALVAVPDYVTLSSTPTLGNERTLTAGAGISLTDGGPGGAVTIANTAAAGAPTTAQYLTLATDATLTNERVLTAGTNVRLLDAGAGGALTVSSTTTDLNVQTGTTYAPVLADAGKLIYLSQASPVTFTVPTDLSVPYPLGTTLALVQGLAGRVTIVGAGGVTLLVAAGRTALTRGQYAMATLVKVTAGAWTLTGDLEETPAFLTLGSDGTLTNERVLTAGTNISLVDGGAGGALTVNAAGGAPTTAQYLTLAADASLTNERVLTIGTGINFADGGAGGAFTLSKTTFPYNFQATAAYTLVLADAGKALYLSNATPITLTVPHQTTAAFPESTFLYIIQPGAGQITVVPAVNVAVYTPPGMTAKTKGQYSVLLLQKLTGDSWYLSGGLEDTTSYLTLGAAAGLPNERVLTAGAGISLTDGGAGGALTVATVAGSQAAIATAAAGQALGAAVPTTITFATEVLDVGNNFAASLYTVPVTGVYQINIYLLVSSTAAGGQVFILVNGATVDPRAGLVISAGGGFQASNFSALKSLTAGQTVGVSATMSNASSVTLGQFDIHRVA
jgi:hypothetical protein